MPGMPDPNLVMLDQLVRVALSEALKAVVWLPLFYLVAVRPIQKALRKRKK